MGINYNEVFKNIKSLCVKTLMAVEPEIVTAMRTTKHRGQCFEIYGFDVLIDSSFKPWLLEVNVAPSLSSSSPYDKLVKTKLLSDTLHLVGFNIFDRRKMEEEKNQEKKTRGVFRPELRQAKSVYEKDENDSTFNNNNARFRTKQSVDVKPSSLLRP